MYKGFSITYTRDGQSVEILVDRFNPKQKSYDLLIRKGNENILNKIGLIREDQIDFIREMLGLVDKG